MKINSRTVTVHSRIHKLCVILQLIGFGSVQTKVSRVDWLGNLMILFVISFRSPQLCSNIYHLLKKRTIFIITAFSQSKFRICNSSLV